VADNTGMDMAELNRARDKVQEGWLDKVANGVSMDSPRPPLWYLPNKAIDAPQPEPDLAHSRHLQSQKESTRNTKLCNKSEGSEQIFTQSETKPESLVFSRFH